MLILWFNLTLCQDHRSKFMVTASLKLLIYYYGVISLETYCVWKRNRKSLIGRYSIRSVQYIIDGLDAWLTFDALPCSSLNICSSLFRVGKSKSRQVRQWMTDACRRMVSRDRRPKFTKFGEYVSTGQTPNHAKFHRTPPNGVREKRYIFLHPSLFVAQGGIGPKFTNLGGDV